MRKRALSSILILSLTALLAACSVVEEKEKERAAITAALQKYLSERSGLNLANMDWKITNFNTDRDTADVRVTFTSKQGDASMVMDYQMKRENGVWSVRKAGPRGAPGTPVHPGADQPPTTPPPSGAGALPPGHPPITSQPPAPTKAQPTTPKKSN